MILLKVSNLKTLSQNHNRIIKQNGKLTISYRRTDPIDIFHFIRNIFLNSEVTPHRKFYPSNSRTDTDSLFTVLPLIFFLPIAARSYISTISKLYTDRNRTIQWYRSTRTSHVHVCHEQNTNH